ncbi:hypothetical protein B9Z51_04825 [Limnohabitans sp. T6-5]|uniref:hypothetical protein n=1 Tax=Limnohabitans sp. T6-5 TaxID=1100724 RepID=UPI000D396E50|nr:hypothetical protein [Limnohabitans sp. T6-5]PUE11612.1 hypothetical protein B9Z51_04825 [Limnohabitans sp. T6-5]
MTDVKKVLGNTYIEHITEHYRKASEELLHAYQRNKEAMHHHEVGAFKAALHHARLSKHHSFNAHEHLNEALEISEKMHGVDVSLGSRGDGRGGPFFQ